MKKKLISRIWMLFVLAAIAALTLSGCSGDNGANGTSSGTVTGLVTDTNSNRLAGITVTPSPAVTGVVNVSTDANGNYSLTIPNGNFTLTFAKAGYTSQSLSATVVSGQTTTLNVPNMVQTAAAVVNAASTSFNASGTATLSATALVNDPALVGQTATFEWKDAAGTVIGTGSSISVTKPSTAVFKAALAELVKPLDAIGPAVIETDPVTGEENEFKRVRNFKTLDRVMVVGIPMKAFEDAALTAYTVTATISGQAFSASPTVSVPTNTLPFVPNPGLRNVPIGQPVMLQGKNNTATGTWNWTIVAPAGSAVTTLIDPTTRFPHFIPDVVGTYTVTETISGITLTIYAGTYVGILVPNGTDPKGIMDVGCSAAGCHNATSFATPNISSKFTEWNLSGHREIMVQAINDPSGHYSLTNCGKCHSVGFAMYSSSIKANGFKEAIDATKYTFTQGQASFVGFDQVLRLSEVQCESCHGPNNSAAHNSGGVSFADKSTSRISYSADACAFCHGEPLRHGRFQEWRESGHGDYATAVAEGFTNSGGTGTNLPAGSKLLRGGCAGCHTSQGFIQFVTQLQSGRSGGNRRLDSTSAAALVGPAFTAETKAGVNTGNFLADPAFATAVTPDNIQPQTCVTCHTPHNPGKQPGITGNIVILRGDYQSGGTFDGNTPLLPSGFQANGVGRGALCITCHNSRNGANVVTEDGAVSLHEDLDTFFGNTLAQVSTTANSYSTPHAPAQGDVLMGRNAYYVTGQRSKHAMLSDACVTCHLQKAAPDPTLGYPANLSGAGTNHGFSIVTKPQNLNDPSTTVAAQVNALCNQCHGSFEGTGVQKSYDSAYKTLITEIGLAAFRVKNAGVNPAAGVTVTFTPGSTPKIAISNVTPAGGTLGGTQNLATYLGGATGPTAYLIKNLPVFGSRAGVTVNLSNAVGATNGFLYELAKANWNVALINSDGSAAVHNPSFTFDVINKTLEAVRAL